MSLSETVKHILRRAASENSLRDAAGDRNAAHTHGSMAALYRRLAGRAQVADENASDRARSDDWESEGGSVARTPRSGAET